ncbi:Cell division protein FtsI/penicillin-binding protein 2 [Nocardioides terrae]|uniref:Beta-lactamase n=1 Tax=Nocardioides terrae TaxID=574651 RepID=A0A1I1H1R2_9ACTN|nr:penicillin-binding transpeptidase domain-containing protein [Nocardioides terrae]SFC18079.1 Cell division protein FtsI/penicillin-binding protein 2 [Nocardioides terrae]
MRRALGALALTVLVVTSTTACGDDEAGAKAAAADLAKTLQKHTLKGVRLTDAGAAKQFGTQVADLESYPVEVRADSVRTDGDAATARLSWEWQVGGHEWSYRTTAALTKVDDEWRVAWKPTALAPDLAAAERIDVKRTLPGRADILGAGDRPVVTERRVYRFGLDKARLPAADVPGSAQRIAAAVGVDSERFVKEAQGAGPKAFVEAIVLRPEDSHGVEGFGAIPGALILPDRLPLAPTRDFGAGLLGTVGPATAEVVEKSDGRVQGGDEVGLSGLQARYDEQLAGTPDVEVRAVGEGTAARTLATWPGTAGQPLRLTLDLDLQKKAERILTAAGDEKSPASAIVAIRPSTGDVLAAANGPGNGGQDIADYGHAAPGSTFKIVSSLALLRAGLKPDDVVDCPATVDVNGKRFKNYSDYPSSRLGRIAYRTAIANSCNTAVIGQRDRLKDGDLADAAAALGLGVDHDLGFPAYFGQVPPPAGETEKAADLIGQGKVLASPLAMATVAASVAAGHVVVPHLIDGIAPTASPEKPLTATEAKQLRGLMRAVVTEGSGRFLAGLGDVGAKTGTAEYGDPRPDGSLPTHVWMIATRGDLAVAVYVETGESGSQTAGPLLKSFLS